LNWAHAQWPDMALATSGAKGGEKLAIKWAKQKGVTLVLAKPDFDVTVERRRFGPMTRGWSWSRSES
jgi:hypothetical protein